MGNSGGVSCGADTCASASDCTSDNCQLDVSEVHTRGKSTLPSAPIISIEPAVVPPAVSLAGHDVSAEERRNQLPTSSAFGSQAIAGAEATPEAVKEAIASYRAEEHKAIQAPVAGAELPCTRQRRVHVFESGARYEGSFRGSARDGHGIQSWPDGATYNGQWASDKAEGAGCFTHSNGDIYTGEWVCGKAGGEGEYRHKDGTLYRGQWFDDAKHGQGRETWVDGEVYEGKYLGGVKHGEGRFEWADGSFFQGEFYGSSIHGTGTCTWSDGRSYRGQWHCNCMHGQGHFRWQDGRSYIGGYVENQKHGRGLLTWPDGKQRNVVFNLNVLQLEGGGDDISGDWAERTKVTLKF